MSTIQISAPDVPGIEGLSFRPLRGEEDTEALYAIHTGRVAHDQVDLSLHREDMPSLESLRRYISQTVVNSEQDYWLVAQVNGQVVGYTQIETWHEEDSVWVYFIGGWVLPEWRDKGIGTAMLRWGETLARQSAATQHPNERFEFASNASSTEANATGLLQNEGYYVVFTTLELRFDLSTTLPATPSLLDGLEVRPLLPEHCPQLIDSIIECYHNAFPGNRFRTTFDRVAYFTEKINKASHDPNLCFIAWDGNEIAGQVILVKENDEVYVDQVSVRPAWRRKGLARALLIRALRDVLERGEKKIWLDTYAEYQTRAMDLYQSLGFRIIKAFPRYRKTA
jgi:ribosomal protein S18 acetylase RimI-like enzyme